MEIWKSIKGYEGKYWVSNLGRVKNSKEQILKQSLTADNMYHNRYYKVSLWKNGYGKNHRVSRLVAEAFIPNPLHLPEVNHKDENKLNNNVSNLEWCTSKYNRLYSIAKHTVPIQCIETGVVYPNKHVAAEDTGIHPVCIISACAGRQKTAGGYHWKYIQSSEE